MQKAPRQGYACASEWLTFIKDTAIIFIAWIILLARNVLTKVSEYGLFSWSAFSYIRTEYRDLWGKSQLSVRIQKNSDQKKLYIWILFCCSLKRMWLLYVNGVNFTCKQGIPTLRFAIQCAMTLTNIGPVLSVHG